MSIEKILEKMSKMDYGTLLDAAKYAGGVITSSDYVKSLAAESLANAEDVTSALIVALISEGIGADGKFTTTEKFFISDFLKINISQAVDKIKTMYASDRVAKVNAIADNADSATKAAIIQLICAVCACDGRVTCKETELIKKLMEE